MKKVVLESTSNVKVNSRLMIYIFVSKSGLWIIKSFSVFLCSSNVQL